MICLPFILRSTPIAVNQRTAELKFSLYIHSMFFKVLSFTISGTSPMQYGYTRLYELRFICTIEFINHIQLSTRIMLKRLREAKLRLVIKTDIKDISSVGQSLKRMTLAQDTKFKCVGYG